MTIDPKVLQHVIQLTEEFFGTQTDQTQIPINLESYNKLMAIWPRAFTYELDNNGKPISWAVVVPTSTELMNKFLTKVITERQLLDQTVPAKNYESLYLCSVFTSPTYRRQGLALKLLIRLISAAPVVDQAALFAWPITLAGEKIINNIEIKTGRKVLLRPTS